MRRLPLLFVMLVVVCGAAAGSVAVSQGAGGQAQPAAVPSARSAPLEPLDSTAKIEEQRRSDARRREAAADTRHRDGNLSDSGAVSALMKRIPGFMGRRLTPSLTGDRARTVRRYLGANRAIVRQDGKNALVQSLVPLRMRPGGNAKKDAEPVDAAIVTDGDVLRPKNTPSAFELAPAADRQHDLADRSVLRFPRARFGIRLGAGADGAADGTKVVDKVVYPNVGKDVDLVTASISTGAQVLYALRSEAAPEDIAFEVTGAGDLQLREAPDRLGIEVLRKKKRIGTIQAPVAFDANDQRVSLDWTIEGRKVRMRVSHRKADVAFPVLIDPVIVDDQRYWVVNSALDMNGWEWRSTDGNGNLFPHVEGAGFYGNGLSIYQVNTSTYPAGSRGQFQFVASGDPTHPTEMAHISSVDFGYTAHLPSAGTGSCMIHVPRQEIRSTWRA